MLVVVLGLLLGGCGGLPDTSPVQPGLLVDTKVDQQARVVVSAPIKGAPQDVIARDFVRSGASFQDTDENQQVVGRAYLAPSSVDRWRPTSAVTVYDAPTGLTIDQLPADQVRLSVNAVATIDATGHYTELPPGTTRSVVLSMVKIDGQWRIDLPREGFGLWLNTDDVDRVFGPENLYYVVAGTQRLVSQTRWFPLGARFATALARAQLGPVPAYLEGVAQTAVPPTAQLAVDAVDVDESGTATVVLTNTAETVEAGRRRAMWAQFVATLLQVPTILGVSLEVQGIGAIPVPNLPKVITGTATLGYAVAPAPTLTVAAVRRGEEVQLTDLQALGDAARGPTSRPMPGAPGPTHVPTDYTGLALSPDGGDLAGVARSRRELVRWRGGVPLTEPSLGTALTDPSYDDHGRLWVAGLASGVSTVWTLPSSTPQVGAPSVVRADWLGGRRVVALRVSPDGTLAAVISARAGDGGDSRLDVAGIQRDGVGVPIALAVPYRQAQPLVDLQSVVWLDSSGLAVLGREKPGAVLRPFAVAIGGGVGLRRVGRLTADQLLVPAVSGAERLTTRGGLGGLVALTGTGVQLRVGGRWEPLTGVRDLVVAGL